MDTLFGPLLLPPVPGPNLLVEGKFLSAIVDQRIHRVPFLGNINFAARTVFNTALKTFFPGMPVSVNVLNAVNSIQVIGIKVSLSVRCSSLYGKAALNVEVNERKKNTSTATTP